FACGRFSFTPCWMSGAVTMKMIKSTSITSTIGVTLISLIVVRPGSPRLPMAMAVRPLLEEVPLHDVEEVRGEVAHLGVEHPDPRHEGVVGHHRGDGGEQAGGGGEQRVADGR